MEDCEKCIHYDWEQAAKMFGHPCEIHGRADSFLCSDFKKIPDKKWTRDANTIGRYINVKR